MNQKNNKRYQDNHLAMESAFLALLKKKDVSRVSVRDICEAAQVNRSTFYHHYIDIYDLMSQIYSRIQKEFFSTLSSAQWGDSKWKLPSEDVIIRSLIHFSNYADFYIPYLHTSQNRGINPRLLGDLWENHFVPIYREAGITDERIMEYYYLFYQAGALQIILHWLENGCQEEPEQVARIIFIFMPKF